MAAGAFGVLGIMDETEWLNYFAAMLFTMLFFMYMQVQSALGPLEATMKRIVSSGGMWKKKE